MGIRRHISSIKVGGITYPLMEFNDYRTICSYSYDSENSMVVSEEDEIPDYVDSLGTEFRSALSINYTTSSTGIAFDVEPQNAYLKNSYDGTNDIIAFYNSLTGRRLGGVGWLSGDIADGDQLLYQGIILDDDWERGWSVSCTYFTDSRNYRVRVSGGGNSQGKYIYDAFRDFSAWRNLDAIIVDGVRCPLLQIADFSIIPDTYGGQETLIRRETGIYTPTGVSSLGSEFAQPTVTASTRIRTKTTNYPDTVIRTYYGYNSAAKQYGNSTQLEFVNTVLMTHGFLLGTEPSTRLYIGIALNDEEKYGCCYYVAQYPERNWTTENYSGGKGEIGYLIYSIFGDSKTKIIANGGGATHIAKATGQLKDLSSNLSDILIASGGGGGGFLMSEPWDGSETDILWSGNDNKLTVQIDNSTVLFKMYTGNTEIYSFTSLIGSTLLDVNKINVSFLIDEANAVAKPSFIYDMSDYSYRYNQESPTDEEMSAIYTWLSAGL